MKNLTKNKITGINLGVLGLLGILAPVMIQVAEHLPAKYLWLAPVLVQLGNWLLHNRALNSPTPNLASRKALKTALDIARECHKDANLVSQDLYKQDITELTGAQMSSLINYLKGSRKATFPKGNVPNIPRIPPMPSRATNDEAVVDLRDSEASDG